MTYTRHQHEDVSTQHRVDETRQKKDAERYDVQRALKPFREGSGDGLGPTEVGVGREEGSRTNE